jgi:hypothetical protein
MDKDKLITALKTQCILSFIMCAFWFIICPMSILIFSGMKPEMLDALMKANPEQAELLKLTLPYLVPIFTSILVLNIISFIGIFLMYRLNQMGLYIYIIGELSTFLIGIVFKPEYLPNQENISGSIFQTLIMIGIDSLFIFQYRNLLKAILNKQ